MRGLENLARLRLDYVKVDRRTAVSKATVVFFFIFFPFFFPTVFAPILTCRLACARQSRGCLCCSRVSVGNGWLSVKRGEKRQQCCSRENCKTRRVEVSCQRGRIQSNAFFGGGGGVGPFRRCPHKDLSLLQTGDTMAPTLSGHSTNKYEFSPPGEISLSLLS